MLLNCSSIRSLNICKHRDSNEIGNHFHIFNARMVQSAESAWTVLHEISNRKHYIYLRFYLGMYLKEELWAKLEQDINEIFLASGKLCIHSAAVSVFVRPTNKQNHQRGKSMKQNSNLNRFQQPFLFWSYWKWKRPPKPLLGCLNWISKRAGAATK